MKTNPKIKRIILNDLSDTGFVLLGIVSAEPDYKISLSLNKKLGISLRITDPVVIDDEQGSKSIYSRFSYSCDSSGIVYDLTSNRSGKSVLLKKMKNIDYFFLIHNADNERDTGELLSMVRDAEYVTAAFKLEIESIKDKNLKYLII